jgi:hypothetical protein
VTVRYFDVFNGDADGICALHQLRLADPVDSQLVTGLKRDIELLKTVPAKDGDVVTVLDLSLDRNREALVALLARGVVVRYFDHHYAGAIPDHPCLEAMIGEGGALCTSVLVDRHLRGRHRSWAVVGAFGDNLPDAAVELARTLALDAQGLERLRELGVALNYNAYGDTEADVLVAPGALYRIVRNYGDPFELFRSEPVIVRLIAERSSDLERAVSAAPQRSSPRADAYFLPDASWSRRVRGALADRLSVREPHRAHAVLTPRRGGGYTVSVRSPRGAAHSAVEFCRHFPTGGGRHQAAGIDCLDAGQVDAFFEAFSNAWSA